MLKNIKNNEINPLSSLFEAEIKPVEKINKQLIIKELN